ncbi:putative membrane protein [Vibrio maritimus]|uniref:Putative membrane protein n=1 Tax=Vibrio maritimus TaxID=990268 RepID=A0A090TFX0_9VIBR|nr:putative membrane protein [Vibrio maritimus]
MISLIGMMVSFLLLYLFTLLSTNPSLITISFIGALIARIIYGCTASGIVPACQHWATLICGSENRLKAITSVSIGLSAGRLIGPLVAIAALKVSPYAALCLMVVLPAISLTMIAAHPAPEVSQQREKTSANLPWLPGKKYLPYLVCAITLCVGIALLQYSFSPLILSITDWSTSQVSDVIGILLTISAACTFAVQTLIVKARKVTPIGMFRTGAIMFSCGFVLFLAPNIWCYGIAMAIVSSGAALLVPAYTSEATSKQPDAPGTVAGYIATSHTIGYGLASLLAFTATLAPIYPIYLGIGCSILIAVITYLLSKNADDSRGSEHCES